MRREKEPCLVRRRLDLLAHRRPDGTLDPGSEATYWELCEWQSQLLDAEPGSVLGCHGSRTAGPPKALVSPLISRPDGLASPGVTSWKLPRCD